ncbi:MAG TPA: TIR domain-containing protein [Ktedonobacteraceae bacterium]
MKSGIELFLCSALEDEPLRTKLEKHLQTLRRYGLINALWSSQDIVPGAEVDQEISRYLKKARMILLLISPNFLSSDDCYTVMEQAMNYHNQGKALLIPVLLRPVHWKDAPFGKLKILPTNEKPVTDWSNVDAALYEVADGVRRAIENWSEEKAPSKPMSMKKTSRTVPGESLLFSFSLLRTLVEHVGPVASVAFSSDGELLLSDSWDYTIKIWKKEAGVVLQTLKGHEGTVSSAIFSEDMSLIASGSDDCTVQIWEQSSGRRLQTIKDHAGPVSSVALSTDQTILVSGSDDCTMKQWMLPSGRLLRVFKGHDGPVSSVALSADSTLIVSGSYDKTVRVWDATSGKVLRILRGHKGSVSSVALSTHGQLLISGSYDKTIRVWSRATGQFLGELTGHSEAVLSVAFHPNGRTIASGSLDKTIKIWQLPPIALDATKNVSIVIIGTGEVERKYVAALVHQMQQEWGPQTEGQIQMTGLTPEMSFLASSRGEAMGPLISTVTVRRPTDAITVNLLLYASAGEDISDPHQLTQIEGYIAQADGFIVLADPMDMPGIRSRLPDHLLPLASEWSHPATARPLHTLYHLITRFNQFAPVQPVDKPIAIVLLKPDLLQFLPSHEGDHIQQVSSSEETLQVDSFSTLDQQVRSLLHAYGEDQLLNISALFQHTQFFAASATEYSPDRVRNFPGMPEPYQRLDPLFWLLSQLGLIEAESAK